MSSSKRTTTPPKEWAKHLRPSGKKTFWSSVRNMFRSEEKENLLANENIPWPRTNDVYYQPHTEKELIAAMKDFDNIEEKTSHSQTTLINQRILDNQKPVPPPGRIVSEFGTTVIYKSDSVLANALTAIQLNEMDNEVFDKQLLKDYFNEKINQGHTVVQGIRFVENADGIAICTVDEYVDAMSEERAKMFYDFYKSGISKDDDSFSSLVSTIPDLEIIKITAADFNGKSFDGSPFISSIEGKALTTEFLNKLESMVKNISLIYSNKGCTDYATWDFIDSSGVVENYGPGDFIVYLPALGVVPFKQHQFEMLVCILRRM